MPLLTVETELDGDSKRTNERGPFLVGLLGCRPGTRDFCSALAALDGPVKKFFLAVHYFISFVPIAQQAGQVAVLDRLSLTMYLWSRALQETILIKKNKKCHF